MLHIQILDGKTYFHFNDAPQDEFDVTIDMCREFYLTYDHSVNMWTSDTATLYNWLLLYKKRYDPELDLTPYYDYLLPEPNTKFKRRPVLPELLTAPPLGDFQIEGIRKGIQQNNFCLWWGMGSGKTYTMISILNHLQYHKEIDKILILCPSQGLYNWIAEFKMFSYYRFSDDDFYVASTLAREPFQDHHKIVLMTYDTFRLLSDNLYRKSITPKTEKGRKKHGPIKRSGFKYRKPQYQLKDWGKLGISLILDESHYIKNDSSERMRVLKVYRKFFSHKYLLSGTPHPKGIQEAYSQIAFLEPHLLPSYFLWLSNIAEIALDGYGKYDINYINPVQAAKFVDDTKYLVDRRTTEDCITLPEHYIKLVRIGISKKQEKLYRLFADYTLQKMQEEHGRLVPSAVRMIFPYLLQALHDPCLLKNHEKIDKEINPTLVKMIDKWKFEDNSKIEICDDLVKDIVIGEGEKVVIFSNHPRTCEKLAERYKKHNPIVLHGEQKIPKGNTKEKFRYDEIEKFKHNKDYKMVIANPAVISEAINITQCKYVIYFSRDYNTTVWLQSFRRFVRQGQTEHVTIYVLALINSLEISQYYEMKMEEVQLNKVYKKDSLTKSEWQAIFTGKLYEDNY